jgi:hypothetical protein
MLVSEQTIVDLRRTALVEHPAAAAWRRVASEVGVPTRIVALQETQKSAVYRLDGTGPGGASLIAKRCRAATAAIERVIYEEVLPYLPVTTLRYYGLAEDDECCWIFLEEADGVPLSILLAEHLVAASRWLALVHTSAIDVAAAAHLPERGAAYYLAQLRAARERILRGLDNPALGASDRSVLEAVIAQCDRLESRWHRVEECCEESPRTLVHGDFRRKNVRVRRNDGRTEVVAIDWEMAGWGTPAVDLASARALPVNLIDVPTYCSIAQRSWPGINARSIQRLISIGWVFRRITAIGWDSLKVTTAWPQKAVASMRVYQAELAEAMRGPI